MGYQFHQLSKVINFKLLCSGFISTIDFLLSYHNYRKPMTFLISVEINKKSKFDWMLHDIRKDFKISYLKQGHSTMTKHSTVTKALQ